MMGIAFGYPIREGQYDIEYMDATEAGVYVCAGASTHVWVRRVDVHIVCSLPVRRDGALVGRCNSGGVWYPIREGR